MSKSANGTAHFGELVVAAFDQAASYSTDPWEVSRLATEAVIDILNRGIARIDPALSSPPPPTRRRRRRNASLS